jgi:HD-GYP domain-containing protein (c-di-GMP phosphodiesterase class II)
VKPATATATATLDTADLRVGMFVHLDLGWMSHPFALSSFRISDANQIETIRSLGLARVRWSPDKSDTVAHVEPERPTQAANDAPVPSGVPTSGDAVASDPQQGHEDALAAQRRATALVERQYAEAARDWRRAMDLAIEDPQAAGQRMAVLSRALVDKMLGARELSIRALAATPADRASHAMNVGIIALLMGRQCGLSEVELHDLGVGALAHDVGKIELPTRVHRPDDRFSAAELAVYREHVAKGVVLGKRMGLAPGAMLVIAQHHEHCDGSGFPQGLDVNRMSMAARMVALVNRYDNLCHALGGQHSVTPHEALSLLFSQGQKRYDTAVLSTFVRMMGVYPPGSVVQLTDDRYAIVESVDAARPLKPKVTVHDPKVPRDETMLLDLATVPELGIRRALPAHELPRAVQEHLMPATRMVWFFEAHGESDETPTATAKD